MKEKEESMMDFLAKLVYDIFFTSFFIYAVSFFLESFYKGIVVNYVNLKIVLVVCIISGLCSVARPPRKIKKTKKIWTYVFIFLFAGIAAVFTYQTSSDVWKWRWIFSCAVGIALTSVLIILSHTTCEDT